MKMLFASITVLLLASISCLAQNVAINEDGSLPDSKAILDIKSVNKGILIPRMSTAQRLAITPVKGLLVYDTTTNSFWYNLGERSGSAGWKNLATGAGWSLTGNSGTIDRVHFLGTTDSTPLNIRVNNQPAGRIEHVLGNTYLGYQAGASIGGGDTACTAIGNYALRVNEGPMNTAVGTGALASNFKGRSNTAIGHRSMAASWWGTRNTAVGGNSLSNNSQGHLNTAIGHSAMEYSTMAYENTAVGVNALRNNTTGSWNTAIGSGALSGNIKGSSNTAIGFHADVNNDSLTNATAIGYLTTVNANNKVRIGNSAVTVIEGQVPFTTPSDGRFKFKVKEDVKGLDFILQLRPVTYQFDVKRFDARYSIAGNNNENPNGNYALQASYDEAACIRRSGFIAQEVEKAAVASGYNFSGIIQPKTAQEHYGLSYEAFVVPLVKAVQEQQSLIADLQQQINELKQLLQKSK
ncbi:tail fiber domain-containing protein [Niastella caeni]|nr:tail fiber domain-containing protein [Niastella caeni]